MRILSNNHLDKKLLIDRDGTLVGTCRVNFEAYSEAFTELSQPVPGSLEELLHQGLSWSEIVEKTAPGIQGNLAKEIHARKRKQFCRFFHLLNWNEELIEEIQGRTWAIVSNGSEESTQQILDQRPELKPIAIVGPNKSLMPKPSSDMYSHLLERFSLTAGEILVIEDSVVGLRSAEGIGLDVLMVQHRC